MGPRDHFGDAFSRRLRVAEARCEDADSTAAQKGQQALSYESPRSGDEQVRAALAVALLVVVRVVHVRRTVTGGTDRLVDLPSAGVAADLLYLVLQFRHLAALRLLLDLLLLLLDLRLHHRLVDILVLHRVVALLLELHVGADRRPSVVAVGEGEFNTALLLSLIHI